MKSIICEKLIFRISVYTQPCADSDANVQTTTQRSWGQESSDLSVNAKA
jgi:hypothetical protein